MLKGGNLVAKEAGRNRFHYGFYAAMKVPYALLNVSVTYEQEKELGETSVRLDFIIIKKNAEAVPSKPIGQFFRGIIVCKYKSPEDSLSIDDFYKVQVYVFLIIKAST